jgi:hypothetical protein
MHDVAPSWLKIAALRQHLAAPSSPGSNGKPRFEWLWALDLDAFIMNTTLNLEHHILPHLLTPTASLLVSRDCNGPNFGSWFVRNTPWARQLLDRVWALRHRTDIPNIADWWEQAAMTHLFRSMPPEEVAANVAFLPQRLLNTYPASEPCGTVWEPGDFVLHLAGPAKQGFAKLTEFPYLQSLVRRRRLLEQVQQEGPHQVQRQHW